MGVGELMNNTEEDKTLYEVGERFIVKKIISTLSPSNLLLDGFGNDSAFIDITVNEEEVLVVNTDRSGLNLAYKLGLADAECVGDLGVSHAISDVVAAGGIPQFLTVSLLLPENTTVGFVKKVMSGIEKSATRYGTIVAGGDTKKNSTFAMVVTVIGKAHKSKRLTRSKAKKGDALVVTGHLGSMLLGSIAFKKNLDITDDVHTILKNALIHQHPPFKLGLELANAGIANACMDISDGLSGALYAVCNSSCVGAVIDETKIPINPSLLDLAKSLGISAMQMSLAGGDWEFLYAIPQNKIEEAKLISKNHGIPISIIGEVIERELVAVRTYQGIVRHLLRIEHDSFIDKIDGKGYFEYLGIPQECFGEIIDY
jgi:thiamine-monophosphate kinase